MIEKGTTGNQKILIGEIASIHERIKSKQLKTPIIIIIGKVVDIHMYLIDYIEIFPTLHSDRHFAMQTSQDVTNYGD